MDPRSAYIDHLKLSLLDLLGPTTTRAVRQRDGSFIVEAVPESERNRRLTGRDWPANGMTMIGLERLNNVQSCVERVIADDIPGDLIEAGAWRGGAAILMRALLAVHDEPDRVVWAADSFAGLPPPNPASYPADEGDKHHTYEFLRVSLDAVKRNFARYGYLDDRVRFVEGWFQDTLPPLRERTWSVVRVDGDMYESTIVALESLYPGLSPGGFVILDDYSRIINAQRAVDDYRAANEITAELDDIDGTGVFWRKPGRPRARSRPRLPPVAAEFTRAFWEKREETWANTRWLGVPAQQLPLDLWVLQEIIEETRPEVIVETGTKFGGSSLFMASVLDLIGEGEVISVDVDQSRVREHVRRHPRIELIEGDSAEREIWRLVAGRCRGRRAMVVLDSDHHAAHVRKELDRYGRVVAGGCYLVVQDTIVNGNPVIDDFGPGPGEAIERWLPRHPEFEVDRSREKLMATFQPGGYLRRKEGD